MRKKITGTIAILLGMSILPAACGENETQLTVKYPGLMLTTNLGGPNRMSADQIKAREAEMAYWVGDINKSARAIYDILSNESYADVSAKYFDRGTVTIQSSQLSYNEQIAGELWEKSIYEINRLFPNLISTDLEGV